MFKKVAELSGGERGRLALALLSVEGANFLLLDEPTNHLDIPSQEVLQSVLEAFDGTILLVTHDRYLIDRLATQVWELQDGHLRIFKGNYEEFLSHRDNQQVGYSSDSDSAIVPEVEDLDWVQDIVIPPQSRKAQKQHAQRLEQLESELTDAEAWLEKIKYDMVDALSAQDEAMVEQLQHESIVIQARLETLTAEWDELDRNG